MGSGDPLDVPALGALTVRSNVAGAQVEIDGRQVGETRLDIDLIPGEHNIVVRQEGYSPATRSVILAVNRHEDLFIELTPVAAPDPVILTFSADPPTLRPGESTTLAWQTENATSVTLSGGTSGALANAGSLVVTPVESTTYVLEASGDGEGSARRTLDIQVAARAPKVLSFSVTPERARRGDPVTVSWTTEDAAAVRLNGEAGLSPNGTRQMTVGANATYALEATNSQGDSVEVTAPFTLIGAPKIERFASSATSLRPGSRAKLVWDIANADSAKLTVHTGERETTRTVKTQGSEVVAPKASTKYTLTAYGGSEFDSETIGLEVKQSLVPVRPELRVEQAALDAMSAVSRITLTPAVSNTGTLRLRQTYTADLDTGKTSAGTASDLWFNAKTATARYLTPRNGARLASAGLNRPGYKGCVAARFSEQAIPVSRLPAGGYVCVKTNAGRISELKVTAAAGPSPG
ncbi:MAG: PEGA domain-containing protein, partial [Pseudomonadota bacterium]